jgi:tetratricopeptide (TPR) repeat protein
LEQFNSALEDCAKAVKCLHQIANQGVMQNPEEGLELLLRGNEYFINGEYPEAIQAYTDAFANDPSVDNWISCLNLTLSCIMAGEYEKAAKHLDKLNTLFPIATNIFESQETPAEWNNIAGRIAALKEIQECTTRIEEEPGNISAYLERGKAYKRLIFFSSMMSIEEQEAYYHAAVENYRTALKLFPADEMLYVGLGKIHEGYAYFVGPHSSACYDHALDSYSKAIILNPYCEEALVSRAKLYQKLGEDEKAQSDFTAVLEISNGNSEN